MNHPEIPPNCPYFAVKNGSDGVDYVCFFYEDFKCWVLVRATKYQRKIIAAIAHFQWLNESERIRVLMVASRESSSDQQWRERNTACYAAEDNAIAWRKWGAE